MKTSHIKTAVHGADSFWLQCDKVELYITEEGGHLAPVNFKLKHRWVCPYALSPWTAEEYTDEVQPVIRVLRGDFFCLPFGESKGYPYTHGESANLRWKYVKSDLRSITLELDTEKPAGRITKKVSLRPGERAVYQEHIVSGVRGRFNFGHHAIIQFPEDGPPCHVNTSPFQFGQVKPDAFTNPENAEYSILKTGGRFRSLGRVPLATGGYTSLQEYPARPGYEDLVMVSSKPMPFAWTAVTLHGYVWFALKNPRVLPSTLFWISNGGRHRPPLSGRYLRRLGLEEVNSHFCDGLEVSRKDLLKGEGIPTTGRFSRKAPTTIRMIQGVHQVPDDFGMVTAIKPVNKESAVIIKGTSGATCTVPVDYDFVADNP